MDYFDYLLKEYAERIHALSEAMTFGHCTSFEEYKYVCGQVRGLEAACAVIKDLKQRLETQDDE